MPINIYKTVAAYLEEKEFAAYISKKERDDVPDADFAGPNRTFPIRNQQDVYDAAKLHGRAANPDQVKRNIIKIAKRKGFKLPKEWEKDDK